MLKKYYPVFVGYCLITLKSIFIVHYDKIPEYLSHQKDLKVIYDDSNIYVGFFIENRIPPVYLNFYNDIDELILIYEAIYRYI